ncbi:copper(I)-binding protein [Rhodopseudomonas julia]|uniref:Copper(I)-binding protein n=1 Tax=Rhodopseudomonas julia TaxID=200617 RepID=A0ABU0CAF4_9BRAD|nr:copper chaperone PCu(A)C [Rhodopseudomonas julia]MDQ0327509.1 copper(I)-binding protein [Rhodopseudomonas julia]
MHFRQLLFGAFALLIAASAEPATALIQRPGEASGGTVRIHSGFARATPGPAQETAAYLIITNTGLQPERLLYVETPFADRSELRETSFNEDGTLETRRLRSINIPPGRTITLAPGGEHLVFCGLSKPLIQNERIPVTLTFARAGRIDLSLPVSTAGARQPPR